MIPFNDRKYSHSQHLLQSAFNPHRKPLIFSLSSTISCDLQPIHKYTPLSTIQKIPRQQHNLQTVLLNFPPPAPHPLALEPHTLRRSDIRLPTETQPYHRCAQEPIFLCRALAPLLFLPRA